MKPFIAQIKFQNKEAMIAEDYDATKNLKLFIRFFTKNLKLFTRFFTKNVKGFIRFAHFLIVLVKQV